MEGLRCLVEGDLLRLGEVGSDHSDARCAVRAWVWGFGGCAPVRPLLPAATREAGGSKGGAALPRQSHCVHNG